MLHRAHIDRRIFTSSSVLSHDAKLQVSTQSTRVLPLWDPFSGHTLWMVPVEYSSLILRNALLIRHTMQATFSRFRSWVESRALLHDGIPNLSAVRKITLLSFRKGARQDMFDFPDNSRMKSVGLTRVWVKWIGRISKFDFELKFVLR